MHPRHALSLLFASALCLSGCGRDTPPGGESPSPYGGYADAAPAQGSNDGFPMPGNGTMDPGAAGMPAAQGGGPAAYPQAGMPMAGPGQQAAPHPQGAQPSFNPQQAPGAMQAAYAQPSGVDPQYQGYPQSQGASQAPMPAQAMPVQPAPGASLEQQDFGVAPTQDLRPSEQLHGQTPTSIPGGQVIGTQQLAQLLQAGGQGAPLLLHAYAGMEHLPGAIAVVPAAQGGSFDDQVQQGYGQYLQQATGGDTSKMLVVYCGGPQCWGSYNAALRAIRMGYRNVHWYRGGLQAWQQAGLPITGQQGSGPGQ